MSILAQGDLRICVKLTSLGGLESLDINSRGFKICLPLLPWRTKVFKVTSFASLGLKI